MKEEDIYESYRDELYEDEDYYGDSNHVANDKHLGIGLAIPSKTEKTYENTEINVLSKLMSIGGKLFQETEHIQYIIGEETNAIHSMDIKTSMQEIETVKPTVGQVLINDGKGFSKQHENDAGYDMRSNEDVIVAPMSSAVVSTGTKVQIPAGFVGMVCSRSGLAAKNNLFVLNSPGIVDSGFTGEVKVILFNAGSSEFVIKKDDRIAQMVFVQLADINLTNIDEMEKTSRADGGFGSTGVS